jgi:hypothetical protein
MRHARRTRLVAADLVGAGVFLLFVGIGYAAWSVILERREADDGPGAHSRG